MKPAAWLEQNKLSLCTANVNIYQQSSLYLLPTWYEHSRQRARQAYHQSVANVAAAAGKRSTSSVDRYIHGPHALAGTLIVHFIMSSSGPCGLNHRRRYFTLQKSANGWSGSEPSMDDAQRWPCAATSVLLYRTPCRAWETERHQGITREQHVLPNIPATVILQLNFRVGHHLAKKTKDNNNTKSNHRAFPWPLKQTVY